MKKLFFAIAFLLVNISCVLEESTDQIKANLVLPMIEQAPNLNSESILEEPESPIK